MYYILYYHLITINIIILFQNFVILVKYSILLLTEK